MRRLFATLLLVAFVPAIQAEVRFPSVIGDNMVLQRGEPVPVWGWDATGTKVTVSLGDATVTATAGADGRWTAYLPSMKAGGPHDITVKGTSEATIKNVLVGEVWFCSGQSNMELSVTRALNTFNELRQAGDEAMRLLMIPQATASTEQDSFATTYTLEKIRPDLNAHFAGNFAHGLQQRQAAITQTDGLVSYSRDTALNQNRK